MWTIQFLLIYVWELKIISNGLFQLLKTMLHLIVEIVANFQGKCDGLSGIISLAPEEILHQIISVNSIRLNSI